MRYTIVFSTLKDSTTIHAAGCKAAAKKNGNVVGTIEAPSAAACATLIDRDLIETGRKLSKVCKCVNAKGPDVLRGMLSLGGR